MIRILPVCSTTNRRPEPSPACVTRTGLDRPEATRSSDPAAVGATADAAGPGSRPTRSAEPATSEDRREARAREGQAGAGESVRHGAHGPPDRVRLASRPSSGSSAPAVRVEQEERRLAPLLAGLATSVRPGVHRSGRGSWSGALRRQPSTSVPTRRPAVPASPRSRRIGVAPARSGRSPHSRSSPQGTPHGRPLAILCRWTTRPPLRRPEHDQPAARGPRQAARPRVRGGLRRPGPRVPAPGRSRRRAARARRVRRDPRVARTDGPPARDRARQPGPRLHRSTRCSSPTVARSRCVRASRTGCPSRARSKPGRSRAGIPTARSDRAAGHHRGWRHVLAPAGPALCIGRTLRTNDDGVRQLAELVGGDVRVFDVPYWRGPAELIHLLSVISPVADDLAVVYEPLLPVGPVAAARRSRRPPAAGLGRGVPDARLQRAGRPARRRHPGRGQSRRSPRRWRRPAARSTRTRPPRSGSTAPAAPPA